MAGVVVLISGRGSNMQALVNAGLPVRGVISNKPEAGGLVFARERGIPTAVVDHRQYPSRDEFDHAVAAAIDALTPDLVALAGFMRVLTPGFVQRYANALMNIHPSLLPAFPGLHTHERALQAGVKIHGATVHFVTPELDCGPIIIQSAVPVLAQDDASSLAARVLQQEHVIYPLAVRWFIDSRITVRNGRVDVAGNATQWVVSSKCN